MARQAARRSLAVKALPADPDAYLRQSGLSDKTIHAAGLRSLSPDEWAQYLPASYRDALDKVHGSALLIPYVFPEEFPSAPNMFRVQLFPPVPTADERTLRYDYYQPPGIESRLYLPARARTVLADAAKALWLVDDEQKALAAEQAGLACIAWSSSGMG